MSDQRKYEHYRPLFKTKCVDNNNVELLQLIWYNVIKQTETKYLIKFKNGSANWYSKKRFSGIFKDS
jgi:hypothetical protein